MSELVYSGTGENEMSVKTSIRSRTHRGTALVLVLCVMVVLTLIGAGLLSISYGARVRAGKLKNEAMAMLAAEAGYEKMIFWMSKQGDILGALNDPCATGTLTFDMSSCNYSVQFSDFIGARPVFRIISEGICGASRRTVDVLVIQDISGWDMAMCRIPSDENDNKGSITEPVSFMDGETVNMKVHINDYKDSPDNIDISILGSPVFNQPVLMGESRKTSRGTDKYSGVMNLFSKAGIQFDQPPIRISDPEAVKSKVSRFKASTNPRFVFTPVATANIAATKDTTINNATVHPAVQLEFYVDGSGVGRVRITNDCTVITCHRNGTRVTHDFKLDPTSTLTSPKFEQYGVYAYHYRKENKTSPYVPVIDVPVTDTYVTQTFAGKQSEPGGQICVMGDVILGSETYKELVVKGKVTIVALRTGTSTNPNDDGHIWIADPIVVDGKHDATVNGIKGKPDASNPNVLGLIAQGVVKVIDPGLSAYGLNNGEKYPNTPPHTGTGETPQDYTLADATNSSKVHIYCPVANPAGAKLNDRVLPDPMIIEAAITVGGGGFGAENVTVFPNGHGGRREALEILTPSNERIQDRLVIHGCLVEVCRGIVGATYRNDSDGFVKNYYMDERLYNGILPGNIWLGGRYIPAPAGWSDYRSALP